MPTGTQVKGKTKKPIAKRDEPPADDEDSFAEDRARLAEIAIVGAAPKTILHNTYRGKR